MVLRHNPESINGAVLLELHNKHIVLKSELMNGNLSSCFGVDDLHSKRNKSSCLQFSVTFSALLLVEAFKAQEIISNSNRWIKKSSIFILNYA